MPAHTIYCWYIVDNSVKEVYCFTWKSHFGCFRLFRGCFRPFRGCFRPKKNIKIKNQNKKTANITHRAFLFTWIVHQDLIRIPQNMDKITFRLSFQFPPQADIWGQAEIQALWKIQVSIYLSDYLSIKLSLYVSVYLSICLSIYLSIYLSISIYLICLSNCASSYLAIDLSIYLSLCLSIYLSTCLSASLKAKLFCEMSSLFKVGNI